MQGRAARTFPPPRSDFGRSRFKTGVLAVLACLVAFPAFPASPAPREINGATSVEWLSISSELILRGEFSGSRDETAPTGSWRIFTFVIEEVIKGEYSDTSIDVTSWLTHSASLAELQDRGNCIVFLRQIDHQDLSCRRWPGSWTWVEEGYRMAVVSLDRPLDVFSKEMVILTDADAILQTVREWSVSEIAYSLSWEVPWDSPIFGRLYSGSSVYLIVPAEERYRSHFEALARSERPYDRAVAARELFKYPGEETVAILRELILDDVEVVGHYANDNIASFQYAVRTAAYQSLIALGEEVEQPDFERSPTEEEQRELRETVWVHSFSQALPEGWQVESVLDGETRRDPGCPYSETLLNIEITDGTAASHLILVPKNWRDAPPPECEYLGFIDAQCGRRFYLQGATPDGIKERIIRYFGLKNERE